MKLISILFLLFVIATDCFGGGKTVVANRSYNLSDEEISRLSDQANAGSIVAAIRLSDRYFFDLTPSNQQELREKALAWALVGAENGGAKSQFRVFQLLRTSDNKTRRIRALFWLRRAAKNYNEDAQDILKACPDIDAKYPFGAPCFGSSVH